MSELLVTIRFASTGKMQDFGKWEGPAFHRAKNCPKIPKKVFPAKGGSKTKNRPKIP